MATINITSREFIDLDFSFENHPLSSNLNLKKNVNAIKQSVKNLLLLKRGDKPFHPEIFSPIYDFLFENNTVASQIVLESEITRYLNTYEPRIEVQEVNVSFTDKNAISCEIVGVLRNTAIPVTVNILVERLR